MIYCTVYTGVGDFSLQNILSIVPLLPVYPGGPTNQRTSSKKQRQEKNRNISSNELLTVYKLKYKIMLRQ